MINTFHSYGLFDSLQEDIYNHIHREIYMCLTSFIQIILIEMRKRMKILFYQRNKKKECSNYSLYGSIGVGE